MKTTSLIMMGGGARAAYQAGVLRGLARIAAQHGRDRGRIPFDIICGTSAGAINGAGMAINAANFRVAADSLAALWSGIHAEDVYRTGIVGVGASGARWLSALAFGWAIRRAPRALFDNAPLGGLLSELFDPERVQASLDAGDLQAFAVTALSYTTGRHVTFYQSHRRIHPWRRSQRLAVEARIGVDHLLASSSIPFLFPALPLELEGHHEWFGDGTMRQMSPLSPAIHLGASRILAIGAASRQRPGWFDTVPAGGYPSLAQVGGQALASIFLDGLSADLERLQHINSLLSRMPEIANDREGWRPVQVMTISPSEPIESIAATHVQQLPRTVRALLTPLGGTEARGAAFASYLLFEPEFTQALIDLGEKDALAQQHELAAFLYDVIPPDDGNDTNATPARTVTLDVEPPAGVTA
ncbi:patatin-like phospholipase family protein [Cupriavidus basilensis]|uniref:patatin-like phospholipase family protein n=1 Tax=Cupriavidus basilensis TaxID=68895 RepID=UPI0020A641B9|nr:patatin-like phospholipase family protein [Cupriavidus basilensis]MCP3021293.1 patatin-like phospholipase family protein [Cupriavidus basilensis]MDR3381640.1 patatin-like phospholipase family protein [Cupriavidus basilensis]